MTIDPSIQSIAPDHIYIYIYISFCYIALFYFAFGEIHLMEIIFYLFHFILFYSGFNHPPHLNIRNWSDASQIVKVQFPKSLADLQRSICFETLMPPPLNIYFLGELKHLEAREKILDDSGLKACLDKIVGWNICENPTLPEILFQYGPSPANTPDKMYGFPRNHHLVPRILRDLGNPSIMQGF